MRTVAFLYHEVTDRPESSGFTRPTAAPYKHPVSEFRLNLDAIARSGIRPSLVHERQDGHRILLTFDDGGRSAMTIADELEARDWRGHFLVTTCMIDTPTFLSRQNIVDLANRGHVIGSHSHSHPNVFRALPPDVMSDEWTRSIGILEDVTGETIDVASIPGGDRSLATDHYAAESGIRHLFTSEPTAQPWRAGGGTCYGRVSIVAGTSVERVAQYALGKGFARAKAMRAAKRTVKRILGPIYTRRMQEIPTR